MCHLAMTKDMICTGYFAAPLDKPLPASCFFSQDVAWHLQRVNTNICSMVARLGARVDGVQQRAGLTVPEADAAVSRAAARRQRVALEGAPGQRLHSCCVRRQPACMWRQKLSRVQSRRDGHRSQLQYGAAKCGARACMQDFCCTCMTCRLQGMQDGSSGQQTHAR